MNGPAASTRRQRLIFNARLQMIAELAEDLPEYPGLHALPDDLDRGRVVTGPDRASSDSFELRLTQESRPERRLHEGPGVDLGVALRDDGGSGSRVRSKP